MFTSSAQAADEVTTITDVRESQIAATADPYAGYHFEGTGKYQVINEGLQLTDQAAFVRGYTNNTVDTENPLDGSRTNADLKTLGASTVTATGSPVAFRVFVYSDQVDATDKLTTLSPAADGTWTSTAPIGTTVRADTATPVADVVTAIGDKYRVKGFGVFNTSGTAVVSNLTFANITYTFKNNAPVAPAQKVSTKINTPVNLTLAATDVDGNALTYQIGNVVGGAVTGSGTTQTFTPAKNFKGAASVTYTVTDGRGGSATGTVTINVGKLKGKVELYRIHPAGKVSIRNTVSLYAEVTIDGKQADRGMTVYGYAKGKKVVTGKINSLGKVKLTLPDKLPAGNATLKVTLVGSSTRIGDSDSIKVKVKK